MRNIKFPSTEAELASELCSRGQRNALRGCVLAFDGLASRIQRPRVTDVPNPMAYWTRKGFFAINVQAAVGADFKVQFLSAVTAGSCYDSTALATSGLAAVLGAEGSLPEGFWVAGDDAYVAGRRVLTPWPGKNLPWDKDSFNYWHSSSRTFAEQVFGQIVGRSGIFWRPLRFPLAVCSKILRVAVKMHIFLTDRTSPCVEDFGVDDAACASGADILRHQCDLNQRRRQRRRDREVCPLRVALTRRLKILQCRRPS